MKTSMYLHDFDQVSFVIFNLNYIAYKVNPVFLTSQFCHFREIWANYFKSINVKAVFWSAVFENERLKRMVIVA